MQTRISGILFLIGLPSALVAALIVAFVSTQSVASEVKTWTQTSVEDFSGGTLQDMVVRDIDGGALTLVHPMRKVVEEYMDNAIPLHASFDGGSEHFSGIFLNSPLCVPRGYAVLPPYQRRIWEVFGLFKEVVLLKSLAPIGGKCRKVFRPSRRRRRLSEYS